MTPTPRPGRGPGRENGIHVEFLVDGTLSEAALASFPELSVQRGPAGGSLLFGTVVDLAHRDGVLARFRDLGISVVEFRQLPE